MLTAPDKDNRPLFAAKDITHFYLQHCPKIFPQKRYFSSVHNFFDIITRPRYNGKYLHCMIQKLLGDTRLHQTLTNIVIPTFDVKILQPAIFSTFQSRRIPLKDALLSDICIGTSATPTFLPAHNFEVKDNEGKPELSILWMEVLLLTILAKEAAKWGLLGWLYNDGSSPLINMFTQASDDMVDFHASVLFQALHCQKNYLCIQQSDFGNFEFDDAEVIGSTGITMYSSVSWTNQEDYDLCYIWCHFSVDTIRGNDQSGDTFWGKIAANFNKRHPEKKRSLSSLKGRFGKINRQTQCFESQIYKVKQQNPSGLGGEMSLRQKANELFLKNHLPENKHLPHYYQYMHCYEVLIRHPKWNSNNAKSIQSVQTKSKGKQKAQKTGFNSSPGDSGSGRDSNYVDITAGDDSMPSAGEDFRPPGVKKSKKKINVASYLEEKLSAASERMAKVMEDRNTCQVERMGIMKDFVSIERKREERQVIKMELEQKKEERELRKMELDRQMYEDSVMRMDLSALEDEDKEYWQDRKQEIRASWKNRR